MHEITASPEKSPFCPWRTSTDESIRSDSNFGTSSLNGTLISRGLLAHQRQVFYHSHNPVIWFLVQPAMGLRRAQMRASSNSRKIFARVTSCFPPRWFRFYRAVTTQARPVKALATLMRQLTVILSVLTVATFHMCAGILDWVFDPVNNDDIARKQAQFLVWDGVPHPFSATFEKVDIVDKGGQFYLFHVVLTSPGAGVKRDRSSYLVCFKLTENATEFRIVTVIQNASDPPTESEIAIDKRLNRWPVSPPWKAEEDLPRNIKPPGLSIVLDKSRAGSDQ